jgi:hypothetical protein
MKLGKDTASLVNFMLANPKFVKPEVGMDVTECHWTDRSAWRVVAVDKDGKGCKLQRYAPKLIGDYYEQNYIYEDENGKPLLCNRFMSVRYKYKRWKCQAGKGETVKLSFGYRNEYEDPSF